MLPGLFSGRTTDSFGSAVLEAIIISIFESADEALQLGMGEMLWRGAKFLSENFADRWDEPKCGDNHPQQHPSTETVFKIGRVSCA